MPEGVFPGSFVCRSLAIYVIYISGCVGSFVHTCVLTLLERYDLPGAAK